MNREARQRRAKRTRAIIKRVAPAKGGLRLCVCRTLRHIYAQVTTPDGSKTLASASTLDLDLKKTLSYTGNILAARAVGLLIAERILATGLSKKISFDRSGYRFVGRVAALGKAIFEVLNIEG